MTRMTITIIAGLVSLCATFQLDMSLEKEQAEINDALAEEENLRIHTENNNLKEW